MKEVNGGEEERREGEEEDKEEELKLLVSSGVKNTCERGLHIQT